MKLAASILLASLLLGVHAGITWRIGAAPDGIRLLRVSDGREVTLLRAVDELAAARLVFLGELHGQPSVHRAQLAVIRALHEADHPLAVGLEMFRAEDQEVLDRWVEGTVSLEQFLPEYDANWGYPWDLYRDIFMYAREHRIPLIGLNTSSEIVQQVARAGFTSLDREQLQALPPVRCVVDEEYESFIRRAMGMHNTVGREFTHFCEAQLLWDAVMAVNLLEYLEGHPSVTVAVLAGQGHAWKGGIPAQVGQRKQVAMRVILPRLPGAHGQIGVLPEDVDYQWLGLGITTD